MAMLVSCVEFCIAYIRCITTSYCVDLIITVYIRLLSLFLFKLVRFSSFLRYRMLHNLANKDFHKRTNIGRNL